ncbi:MULTISPECIES: acyl-CoA desaturase [Pseudoalteromonas]|uniref:acyl-CoA desaturase n=1 Tax=Pseudoalteromonas TaxID=53246 RepID=UPI00026C9A5D|nr:fatty acid desaturase [Pseudoalteromonas spongiae]ATC97480.1 stearoyl-CoA desaturase (delta-9 desaturase) [Pseudoalteromonas spongiae UST010723-006]
MKKPPIIWLNTLFFTITFLAAVTIVPWYGLAYGYSSANWIAFIACMFYCGLSITAGYHRLWAHKTYETHPVIEFIFAIGGAFSIQNSALHWSSDHRLHHGKVDDTEHDPYAATRGFWYSHIGWMLREYQAHRYNDYSNCRDLQKNRVVMWQHKHYLTLTLITNLGIPLVLGLVFGNVWGMLLLAGLLRLVLSQHFTFFINSLAHIWGSRPYTESNTARDNGFLALFTYGEGYHNFHHIFASDYRNGIRWWHYDPTKWLIKSLAFLGLASKLRKTPQERIERAKAATLMEKTKRTLLEKQDSHVQLDKLQHEYELLLSKIQHYYKVRKRLLEMRKNKVIQQCEQSQLKKQYNDIKASLINQQQNWLALNKALIKGLAIN